MLDQSSAPVDQFNFWKMLQYFWSDGHIQEWRDAILRDQNNPHKGVETCCNLICLSRDAHAYWTKAYFALKPIQLSEDKKSLDVEFHWLPKYNHSPTPVLDILTLPKSLGGRDDMQLFDFRTGQRICSGQRISLTTDDPDNQPLPHLALLEMQWVLHRLTAMSGAAEIYDDFNDDDDDAMALCNEWDLYGEDEWDPYKMNGIHTWKMRMGTHMKKKAHRRWIVNLLRCVRLLRHLSQRATSYPIAFLCGLQRISTSK
jgi:hypothetical protein